MPDRPPSPADAVRPRSVSAPPCARWWAATSVVGCILACGASPFESPQRAAGLPDTVPAAVSEACRWNASDQGTDAACGTIELETAATWHHWDSSFSVPLAWASPVAPLVRAQSPDSPIRAETDGEITLLPLVGDADAEIETASLLGAVTGSAGRIRADYLTDLNQTDRVGVSTVSVSRLGFGLDAEANRWLRPVPGLGREPLWTGDVNLIYSFPPHPRVKFRSGVGPNFRVDRGKTSVGGNVTHGLDVYLLGRAMATGELDWGLLDGETLLRYRLALGVTWGPAELFSGYETYKLGDEHLDGWVSGVSLWY